MAEAPATDYTIEPAIAKLLQLLTTCSGPEREAALVDLGRRVGPRHLARHFAQFIGLANSVVEDEQRRTIAAALSAISAQEASR